MNESLVLKDVSASGSGWAAREIGEQNQMWFWCEFWCPVVHSSCSSAVSQVNKTKQTNGMILGVYHRSVKPVSNCFNDSARLHWLAFKAEFVGFCLPFVQISGLSQPSQPQDVQVLIQTCIIIDLRIINWAIVIFICC